MIDAKGKYGSAKIFTDNIEPEAMAQIIEVCNEEFSAGLQIRIMPDVHAGAGCVIGTTMEIKNKIVPNLVGVDIGCGLYVAYIEEKEIDCARLDDTIRRLIPSGFDIRSTPHEFNERIDLSKLRCANHVNTDRARLSLGTLGGGNHFIEMNTCSRRGHYLVVHSGSRTIGKQVAKHYQDLAAKECYDRANKSLGQDGIASIVARLKAEGRENCIETEIKQAKKRQPKINKQLAYLEGDSFFDYLHDITIIQDFATLNGCAIMQSILDGMGWQSDENFSTIHNYIEPVRWILRKGAISAKRGERVIIPMNMRDGSIIAIGKGNPDWNFSAPHGAGRLMSRTAAKEKFSLGQFKESMDGIFSTSVCATTIDESPMAYKPMQEIIDNIGETVDIVEVIKPIYNFKASD